MQNNSKLRTRMVLAMLAVSSPFVLLYLSTSFESSQDGPDGSLLEGLTANLIVTGILSAASLIVVLILAWRLSRPLAQLARAAEAFSKGETATLPGAEGSPAEIVALSQSMARMAQALADREEKLQAHAELLEQANQSKDEFLGILSHELKSPVAVAYGSAALLLKRRQQLPEADVEQLISSIYEASEQTTRLIDDLLALARTEAGAGIQLEPLSARVVQSSVDSFLRSRPSRKVLLTFPEPAPVLLADQTYVEQVLQNLLSNADKYSPPLEPVEVLVTSNGVEVSVAVRDHGPGVASDELKKMFDSFYRSQRTAAQAPGKGLGLTVCKRLVEAMGGSIRASLPAGGGLEVSFILRQAASE